MNQKLLTMSLRVTWTTHIFLSKVYEVLEVNVITVGLDVIVDEEVELVFDPVLEDESQDTSCHLQEKDEPQEY